MSKLIAVVIALGLVTFTVPVSTFAQDNKTIARCQSGCQKYCADRLGTYKTTCQSRCMDSCLARLSGKK